MAKTTPNQVQVHAVSNMNIKYFLSREFFDESTSQICSMNKVCEQVAFINVS